MAYLGRREFIGLLGCAAVCPVPTWGQQARPARRIAVLMVNGERDPEGRTRVEAFRRGLQELGWREGGNVQIEYHWGVGSADRARTAAAEAAALEPEVIVVNGTPGLVAMARVTRTIPIVFAVVTDPVGAGYVQSLSRPGGNVTGFSAFEPEIGSKWLELLRECTPDLRRVAGVLDPGFKGFAAVWSAIERVASNAAIEVRTVALTADRDVIEPEIAGFAQQGSGGLIVLPTAINNLRRDRIISLAARYRLPAVYPFPHFAAGGGLMAYGFDTPDLFRRSASYVDRILKGARPADLPVQAPVKYEFVLNLKTARDLSLDVPASLLARADQVIE
jgi:putative ABC transport system substrate-binding protein